MLTPWKRAVVGALAAVALAACGGDGGGEDYPPELVNQFLASCTEGGTTRAVCQCALDKLEEKYSLGEFTEEATKLRTGQPSEEFSDDIVSFSLECQREVG